MENNRTRMETLAPETGAKSKAIRGGVGGACVGAMVTLVLLGITVCAFVMGSSDNVPDYNPGNGEVVVSMSAEAATIVVPLVAAVIGAAVGLMIGLKRSWRR